MIGSARARVLALLTDTPCQAPPNIEQIGRLLRPIEVDSISGGTYDQKCEYDQQPGTSYDQKCPYGSDS